MVDLLIVVTNTGLIIVTGMSIHDANHTTQIALRLLARAVGIKPNAVAKHRRH